MSAKRRRQQQGRPPSAPAEKTIQAELAVEPSPDFVPPSPAEGLALINRVQTIRDSHVLTFVTRPDVTVRGDVVEQVYEQLREIGRVPRLDLFLHSSGGQTEIPWRLITLIRDFGEHFAVLIPGIAYSAATHLAMGADEIVMGPLSELSPVDPARSHPLLPSRKEGEPPLVVSVQDLRHCVEFVKQEIGDSAPESLATILAALFDKIHPLAIGAIQQSYALSRLITAKALSTHMNPDTEKDQIEKIVNAFSDEFFSHHYRIGWKEAKEKGLKVSCADNELWETMWALLKHYQSYFSLTREIRKGRQVARPIAWIDTVHQRRVLEEILTVTAVQGEDVLELKKATARWLAMSWLSGNQTDMEE
jgi:hypothetical protein